MSALILLEFGSPSYQKLEVLVIQLNVMRILLLNTAKRLHTGHLFFRQYVLADVSERIHPLDAGVELVQLVAGTQLNHSDGEAVGL